MSPRGYGEVEDMAHGNANPTSHERGKDLREPRAAGEDERVRGQGSAGFELQGAERTSVARAERGPLDADRAALLQEDTRDGLDGPSRPAHPGS